MKTLKILLLFLTLQTTASAFACCTDGVVENFEEGADDFVKQYNDDVQAYEQGIGNLTWRGQIQLLQERIAKLALTNVLLTKRKEQFHKDINQVHARTDKNIMQQLATFEATMQGIDLSGATMGALTVPPGAWKYLDMGHKPKRDLTYMYRVGRFKKYSAMITREAQKIGLNPIFAHVIALNESAYGDNLLGMCLTEGHPLEKKESISARLKALYDPTCPKQPMGAMQILPSTSRSMPGARGTTNQAEKLELYARKGDPNYEDKLRYGISRAVMLVKQRLDRRNGNFMHVLVDYNAGHEVTDAFITGNPKRYKDGSSGIANPSHKKTNGFPVGWRETTTYIWKAYYYAKFVEKYPWLFSMAPTPPDWNPRDVVIQPDYHGGGKITGPVPIKSKNTATQGGAITANSEQWDKNPYNDNSIKEGEAGYKLERGDLIKPEDIDATPLWYIKTNLDLYAEQEKKIRKQGYRGNLRYFTMVGLKGDDDNDATGKEANPTSVPQSKRGVLSAWVGKYADQMFDKIAKQRHLATSELVLKSKTWLFEPLANTVPSRETVNSNPNTPTMLIPAIDWYFPERFSNNYMAFDKSDTNSTVRSWWKLNAAYRAHAVASSNIDRHLYAERMSDNNFTADDYRKASLVMSDALLFSSPYKKADDIDLTNPVPYRSPYEILSELVNRITTRGQHMSANLQRYFGDMLVRAEIGRKVVKNKLLYMQLKEEQRITQALASYVALRIKENDNPKLTEERNLIIRATGYK